MVLENKVLTINNKEYFVVSVINYAGSAYAYLVNKNNEADSMFREVVTDKDNNLSVKIIDPSLFSKVLCPAFLDKIGQGA